MMFCRCDVEEKHPGLFQSLGQLLVCMTSHEFVILEQTNKMFDLPARSRGGLLECGLESIVSFSYLYDQLWIFSFQVYI